MCAYTHTHTHTEFLETDFDFRCCSFPELLIQRGGWPSLFVCRTPIFLADSCDQHFIARQNKTGSISELFACIVVIPSRHLDWTWMPNLSDPVYQAAQTGPRESENVRVRNTARVCPPDHRGEEVICNSFHYLSTSFLSLVVWGIVCVYARACVCNLNVREWRIPELWLTAVMRQFHAKVSCQSIIKSGDCE